MLFMPYILEECKIIHLCNDIKDTYKMESNNMYNYNEYLQTIRNNLCLNENDWYFKSNNHYRAILEHVSYEQGLEYLHIIQSEFENIFTEHKYLLIELCYLNDKYGQTNKCNFQGFCECSPTNLRYIYHALLNLQYLNNLDKKDVDIIEIGGGYGGLCFYMHRLAKVFNINIKSYHIFDLEEATELQEKYLRLLDVNNFSCGNLEAGYNLKPFSYLISNYAFSEFSINVQKLYIDAIISKYISNGLLVWNTISPYKFIDKDIIIQTERPMTSLGDCKKNCFVYI